MIESITIKNVATFSDQGVVIDSLKKVNFFFGYNGSGKSTIAKYLYNLGLEEAEKNEDFKDCTQQGFDKNQQQMLVFDEAFTEQNFHKSDTLKGIFSLNQANETIDKQIAAEEEIIKEYNKDIKAKESLHLRVNNKKDSMARCLKDDCFEERRQFDPFSKLDIKYGRNKDNHLLEIRRVLENNTSVSVVTIEDISNRYISLYEKEIKEVSQQINIHLYKEIRKIERELSILLSTIIIGNEDVDIAALIKLTDSRSWVETGVELLKKTGNKCPFCQRDTVDDNLRTQFEKYFDTTYKSKIENLKTLRGNYETATKSFLANINDIQNEFNPASIVSTLYIDISKFFSGNLRAVDSKLFKPNEKKDISSIFQYKTQLSNVISLIKHNNSDFGKLDENRKMLISDIWTYMASNCKDRINQFDQYARRCDRIVGLINDRNFATKEKVRSSKISIEELRSRTVNTQDAVDKINMILKTSGFEGFEIAEKDKVNNISRYYLKRANDTGRKSVFKSLSEGEKNFISFLYFYQLCLGTDDVETNGAKKKIIVIDDPVSSLDSQVLFVVSTLVRQLIKRKGEGTKSDRQNLKHDSIEQFFILTHNMYFYKEVAFEKRLICTDYYNYRISKHNNQTRIIGEYNKVIRDDYSLLWETMNEIKHRVLIDRTQNITIANIMRRIIDSYISFIGVGRDCWASIVEDSEDPQYIIKCAFISTLNDESHGTSLFDSVYYHRIMNEEPQKLFEIFEAIFKVIGVDHYNTMMGIEPEEL